MELSPQVDVLAAISGDDELRAVFGQFKCSFKVREQFRKQWNQSRLAAGMMLRLRAPDVHSRILPVGVLPA